MHKTITIKTNVATRPPVNQQRGSILILTMVAVFILSLLVVGLLDVGTTEIYSTQNYQYSKAAYYAAVEGVEEIRNLIYNYPDSQSVRSIRRYTTGLEGPLLWGDDASTGTLKIDEEGFERSYITGSMKNMEAYYESDYGNEFEIGNITKLEGFKAPPMPGISLGGSSSVSPVVWRVDVTSEVRKGERKAYAEIISGIYSILTTAY